MCSVDWADPWKVVREDKPVARSPHQCGECRRTIQLGERYSKIEGLLDGPGDARWETYKTCEHCVALGAWMNTVCGGWIIGDLQYELVEHWRNGYSSIPFGRLIADMRLKWHGGTDPVPAGVGKMARSMLAGSVA